jgi:hypothetical protein
MGIAALGVYLSMERDISGNRRDFHILDDRQQTRETMDRDPRSRPKWMAIDLRFESVYNVRRGYVKHERGRKMESLGLAR